MNEREKRGADGERERHRKEQRERECTAANERQNESQRGGMEGQKTCVDSDKEVRGGRWSAGQSDGSGRGQVCLPHQEMAEQIPKGGGGRTVIEI